MLYIEHRSIQVLQIVEISLYLRVGVCSIDIMHWVSETLQFSHVSLYLHEIVIASFNVKYWPSQIGNSCHFLVNLTEVMMIVYILPNRVGHLLETLQTTLDLAELMIPVDLVDRIVECL